METYDVMTYVDFDTCLFIEGDKVFFSGLCGGKAMVAYTIYE